MPVVSLWTLLRCNWTSLVTVWGKGTDSALSIVFAQPSSGLEVAQTDFRRAVYPCLILEPAIRVGKVRVKTVVVMMAALVLRPAKIPPVFLVVGVRFREHVFMIAHTLDRNACQEYRHLQCESVFRLALQVFG